MCEVFGLDRSRGRPAEVRLRHRRRANPARSRRAADSRSTSNTDSSARRSADLVVIPGWHDIPASPPEPMLQAIRDGRRARGPGAQRLQRRVRPRGGRGAGRAPGRHPLAATPRCSRERYPEIEVDPDVLYVEDGPVLTSAGHRRRHRRLPAPGARRPRAPAVANAIARRMVVPPHREGGQAQFIETPIPRQRDGGDGLPEVLDWVRRRLDRPADRGRDGRPGRDVPPHVRPAVPGDPPGPRRTPGCSSSGCSARRSCWRTATCRSRSSPASAASPAAPACGSTSSGCGASRRRPTAARSPARCAA